MDLGRRIKIKIIYVRTGLLKLRSLKEHVFCARGLQIILLPDETLRFITALLQGFKTTAP